MLAALASTSSALTCALLILTGSMFGVLAVFATLLFIFVGVVGGTIGSMVLVGASMFTVVAGATATMATASALLVPPVANHAIRLQMQPQFVHTQRRCHKHAPLADRCSLRELRCRRHLHTHRGAGYREHCIHARAMRAAGRAGALSPLGRRLWQQPV